MTWIGRTYGRWTVTSERYIGRFTKTQRVDVVCVCGHESTIPCWNLKTGRSTSCGCWAREKRAAKRAEAERLRLEQPQDPSAIRPENNGRFCRYCADMPHRRSVDAPCLGCGEAYAAEQMPTIDDVMMLPRHAWREVV
jgi:hypothetical protein